MLIGIGVDIIENRRVATVLKRTSGLKEELFSPAEIAYCESKRISAQHYAVRFAAKEAFFKALTSGKTPDINWKDIEVRTDERGAPALIVSPCVYEKFPQLKNAQIHLSLSHNQTHSIAFLVIEES